MKTPNHKHQIANKIQLANDRKFQTLEFGICDLEFTLKGVCNG